MKYSIKTLLHILVIFFLPDMITAQSSKFSLLVNQGCYKSLIYNNLHGTTIDGAYNISSEISLKIKLNQRLALSIGGSIMNFSTTSKLNSYYNFIDKVDSENEIYEYRIYGNQLNEIQSISFIEIPVALFWQNQSKRLIRPYLRGGIKLLIPYSSFYIYNTGTIETTGYYKNYHY